MQRRFSEHTQTSNSWWAYFSTSSTLKQLFWVYFLLLIFEGALRKWVVPQLSAPLLLIRDPIAMLILIEAFRSNKWPEKWSTVIAVLAALVTLLCVAQVVAGENPWFSALYGLRTYLLPFPVAFVMGENLTAEDLRRFGVCTLWLLLPQTLLEVIQYRSPYDSFVNAGAYEGAQQIWYLGTKVRASGTFSFVIGPMNYGPLAAAFVFGGLVNETFAKRWLLWAATFALILSVPAIGSRTLVFSLGAVVACAGVSALCGVSQFFRSLKVLIPIFIAYILVSLLPVFHQASRTLQGRFTEAAGGERATLSQTAENRTFGTYIDILAGTDFSSHLLGRGMGVGAAAISKLMTGRARFSTGEGELSRVMVEFGPIFGIAYVLFCLGLGVLIAFEAIARARNHQPLAILLFPVVFMNLMLGVLEQPTVGGFLVVSLAFSLTAMKETVIVAQKRRIPLAVARPMRYSSPTR